MESIASTAVGTANTLVTTDPLLIILFSTGGSIGL